MTSRQMKTLTDQVEYCLARWIGSRENDIDLVWCVWVKFYGVKGYVSRENMKRLPTQAGVKRIRAKFNSKGLYLPVDKKVLKKRRLLEMIHRDHFSI